MRRGSMAGGGMHDALPGIAAQVEGEYGVPAKMLIAIWGHETNYGELQGRFRSGPLARHAGL